MVVRALALLSAGWPFLCKKVLQESTDENRIPGDLVGVLATEMDANREQAAPILETERAV